MFKTSQSNPFKTYATLAWVAAVTHGLALAALAQFPMQNMSANRIALAYDLATSGQNITARNTPSQQMSHRLSLAYAPVPYAGLALGLGVARFETQPDDAIPAFNGKYGFSPSLTLRLATPGLFKDLLRVTASAQTQYFSSADPNRLSYSGFLIAPDLGLMISPYDFVDISLGGRLHVINGDMEAVRQNISSPFSNETVMRGYFGLLLKTPSEGAFLSLEADISPNADANWSQGPVESSLRISIGSVLGWKSREPKAMPRDLYFPNYRDLKDRQQEMSDQMQAD